MKGVLDVYKDTKPYAKSSASAHQQRGVRKWINLSMVVLLLLLASTASAQDIGKTQISAKASMLRGEDASKDVQNSISPKAGNYVIGPTDVLEISVWKEPEVSRTVSVRPDGRVSLPLLSDVQAAGLTPAQLAAHITESLKRFITGPQVTVIVATINSQRIYIIGEVTRAGAYPLLPGMTVLQALSSAGGFTQFANIKNICLLRQENEQQLKYAFNYKEAMNGKKPEQNVVLKAGDTIIVP
jgi:polysaccharide export outer membrane protein